MKKRDMKTLPKQFKKVVKFLKENMDVTVEINKMTCYIGGEYRKIFISYKYNLEKNGLFALLHESGHALQPDGEFSPNHYKKHVDDGDEPVKYAMYQFMNEVDAWDRGAELARGLNLTIDFKAFNKYKEECLLTYYK